MKTQTKFNIAIIDDDYDDAFILSEALADAKLWSRPVIWYDPVEAIRSLTAPKFSSIPSHIFVDFNMPTLNGKECVKALRRDGRYNKSVITVVSTNLSAWDTIEFRDFGADYIFKKPGRLPEYVTLLHKIFA
jgi:DNA-binding response OmpR family regulator